MTKSPDEKNPRLPGFEFRCYVMHWLKLDCPVTQQVVCVWSTLCWSQGVELNTKLVVSSSLSASAHLALSKSSPSQFQPRPLIGSIIARC